MSPNVARGPSSSSANRASIFGFGAMLTSAGHRSSLRDSDDSDHDGDDNDSGEMLDDEGVSSPSTSPPRERTKAKAKASLRAGPKSEGKGKDPQRQQREREAATKSKSARILIEVVSAMDLTSSKAWNRAAAAAARAKKSERSSPTTTKKKDSPKRKWSPIKSSPSADEDEDDDDDDGDGDAEKEEGAEGSSDPYCVIRRVPSAAPSPGGRGHKPEKVLHETLPVRRDLSPIWTARSKSLYLLTLDDTKSFELSGGLEFEVLDRSSRDRSSGGVMASMVGRAYSHGAAIVNPEEVLGGDGSRVEYALTKTRDDSAMSGERKEEAVRTGTIALRFRPATDTDLDFMKTYVGGGGGKSRRTIVESEAVHDGGPADFEFNQTHDPGAGRKIGNEYVVQPRPDPSRPYLKKRMTAAEIEDESVKPSRRWVRAGTGTHGTLYLEVLGCSDLPNLDVGLTGLTKTRLNKTDAFVAVLFEDKLVRTDVVFDCLNPRWMPWSQRAFAFPVKHPSSVLMLGVFDYDCGPMNYHDPVGRVIIDPANFEVGTVYNLRYWLRSGPSKDDNCGVIRVRLRIEQPNEKEALLASFGSPARYHVNVDSAKAFSVLRYLSRGPVNMEKASMQTVSLFAGELLSYFEYYLYVIDFLIGVLLWRGRLDFVVPLPRWVSVREEQEEDQKDGGEGEDKDKGKGKGEGCEASPDGKSSAGGKKEPDGSGTRDAPPPPPRTEPSSSTQRQKHGISVSVWFPVQSMVLFEAGVICVERPSFAPAALFLGAAWIMITIMYYRSNYPSPWHRCKTVGEITSVILLGRNAQAPETIRAYEGAEEAAEFDAVDRAKTERIVTFLMAFKTAGLKYKREYYKTDAEALAIETEVKEWTMFESYLYYVHLGLSYLCIYMRGLRNVIMWKSSSYSYLLTATFFLLGLACALLPMDILLKWLGRALVWTFLGPWMKLVDIFCVQSYYRTRAELKANPNTEEPEVESLFKGEKYHHLAKKVRIAAEDAIKLKHMRECRFGAYSARVPPFDESRFPSEPLPESTAEPFQSEIEKEAEDGGEGRVEWVFVPGQRLRGSMIPITEDLSSSFVAK